MQLLETAQGVVHYRLDGAEDVPVMVMLNSLGTDLRIWDDLVERLTPSWRVLRYDLRGHGLTPATPGPYSMELLASDLLALLDALGIDRFALCGLSIGGMIALQVAAHAQGRVTHLALCDTTMKMPEPAMWHERARQARDEGLEAMADAAIERWFTPAVRRTPFAAGVRTMVARTSAEGYAACCEAIAAMDLELLAQKVEAPTRVFVGEHDPATPVAAADAICKAIPQAELTVMPGLYHLACIERPDLFLPAMERFLSP
ncbi:3-oxoadipate enol-lactonase [Methylonatrum kenyense]|uniref:3-oxoadipate enol-lactonase n=1 Tax=Methylonatrum kenyense TaxID=455253 RepID=UPI0020BE3B27|nr:3-oxoadipate enol-lactonase [Methylonatrum kenyense]MCK8516766.1 3-oxoadipate enol-lactonase [Methylonatrum kenyense]